jgi:hypothetical protein
MSPVWIKRNDFKAGLLQFNASSDAGWQNHLFLQLISHWVIGNQRGTRKARLSYFLWVAEIEHKVNRMMVL